MYKFMNTQIYIYIQDLAVSHWITSTYSLLDTYEDNSTTFRPKHNVCEIFTSLHFM